MTEAEFDEWFRKFLPPEYRPGLDARRATFQYAQGQIDLGTMLADIAVGVARSVNEWYTEPRP